MKHTLLSALRAIGRPVAHYPNLSKVFDSNNVGVFLSQMLYWEGKQENEDGWIRKPLEEIEFELGFGRYEMEGIRKKLKERGVMQEKKMGMPAKLHYKIDWDKINDILQRWIDEKRIPEPLELSMQSKKEKKETIAYRMKEAYLEKRKLILPYAEDYNWTNKDWNFIKLFKDLFATRIKKKNALNPNFKLTDDDVYLSWVSFLNAVPSFYQDKQFFPSGLYSNFSPIEQSILEQSKSNNVKAKQGTTSVDFRAAIKKQTDSL